MSSDEERLAKRCMHLTPSERPTAVAVFESLSRMLACLRERMVLQGTRSPMIPTSFLLRRAAVAPANGAGTSQSHGPRPGTQSKKHLLADVDGIPEVVWVVERGCPPGFPFPAIHVEGAERVLSLIRVLVDDLHS